MQCPHLRRRRLVPAHFVNVGISCFTNMAEFDFPIMEIHDDNQFSAHRGDDRSKLIDWMFRFGFSSFEIAA